MMKRNVRRLALVLTLAALMSMLTLQVLAEEAEEELTPAPGQC